MYAVPAFRRDSNSPANALLFFLFASCSLVLSLFHQWLSIFSFFFFEWLALMISLWTIQKIS